MAARSILPQRVHRKSRRWQAAIGFVQAVILLSVAACGGGGSDTLVATAPAQASNQPAPPGGAILEWDAVVRPGVLGYRVYYGTAPGQYLQAVGQGVYVGNVTTYAVTGLRIGSRYYFTVTAIDASGNESGFATEVFKDIS